jgi:hypothetical protein
MQQSSFKLKEKKSNPFPPTNFHSDARCTSQKRRNITAATHSNYSDKRNNPTQNTLQNNQVPAAQQKPRKSKMKREETANPNPRFEAAQEMTRKSKMKREERGNPNPNLPAAGKTI